MKLILVCNYAPDAQQSMLRFGALLQEQWSLRGYEVHVIAPSRSVFTCLLQLSKGRAAKWLGYVDKYLLFPRRLAQALAHIGNDAQTVAHVVDHSNALYVPRRRGTMPWVVTCHDLLAVRGALGEDTDCPASGLGRQLQARIVRGLGRASAIVADSTYTLRDVNRLIRASRPQVRRVVFLGLNHPYRIIARSEARARLAAFPGVPWHESFVLHVGSNLSRKNKAGVLRVFARVAPNWPGNLIFCGAALPSELSAEATTLGVASRIFSVSAPDNAQLEAIYGLAHVLLFPSKSEGFGWPVIEAQACGCPVICSDRTSLPEIAGDAALVHALDDEVGMAASIRKLVEAPFRAACVGRGLANLARFANAGMIDAYGAVYEEVLSVHPR
jgi:glycosyltransferase involved in cell wall biosynthesis